MKNTMMKVMLIVMLMVSTKSYGRVSVWNNELTKDIVRKHDVECAIDTYQNAGYKVVNADYENLTIMVEDKECDCMYYVISVLSGNVEEVVIR